MAGLINSLDYVYIPSCTKLYVGSSEITSSAASLLHLGSNFKILHSLGVRYSFGLKTLVFGLLKKIPFAAILEAAAWFAAQGQSNRQENCSSGYEA